MAYYDRQKHWLEIAEQCRPSLVTGERRPIAVVRPVKDAAGFQGWSMERVGGPDSVLGVLHDRTAAFVLDFGEHIVGRLNLRISLGAQAADAPLRLRLIFAEAPVEIAEDLVAPRDGMSRAWIQDETVTIDTLPCSFAVPRRYAFRYLKVQIVDSSSAYHVSFDDVVCTTVTSADPRRVEPASEKLPSEWRELDRVSLRTLANCMQTVFEDGPKRDRRLWVGDLRLQALANYESFKNQPMVKRCLYLFAGLADADGKVSADLYENPVPRRGSCYILDYAALFPAILLDYLRASGDRQTAVELWPVARRQFDFMPWSADDPGLVLCPENVWVFIDWCGSLHRQAAMQGVLIYAIRRAMALAKAIGEDQSAAALADRLGKMQDSARRNFWDAARHVWVSGEARQVSWASWAWMVLAEMGTSDEARQSYRELVKHPEAVKPNGPYLYHHVVDALFACGLADEAKQLLKDYWGGMIARGATTFWEVYDPADERLSPYGSPLFNSYCHAWSCTPAYFIRKHIAGTGRRIG